MIFLMNRKKRVEDSTEILKDEFKKLNISEPQKQFYNINFIENVRKKNKSNATKSRKRSFY